MAKESKLKFDKRGGVITMNARMLRSENYQTLSASSRSLMVLLHIHWRPDKWVDYGIREAMTKLCCGERTAMKAFKQLTERGFIVCEIESSFSSRTQSKSRSWRLTWMPYGNNNPSNNWEEWSF